MVGKIVSRLNSINSFSKKIIITISILSFILCSIGIGVILYNSAIAESYSLYNIGSSMIYSSIVLFAQFVIGSLVIDLFNMLINNKDD